VGSFGEGGIEMQSRRDFLASSPLLALAPTVPGFLARTAGAAAPARDERALVVVEMDGGNDGLNTVVPFRDANYPKFRPTLRQAKDQLVKVNGEVGLHPSLKGLDKLLGAGRLCVVQGVGYPNPNRSHVVSMAIWQTARLGADERAAEGWLGRAFDAAGAGGGAPGSVFVGGGAMPAALRGRRSVATALTRPEDFLLRPEVKAALRATANEGKEGLAAFVGRVATDAYGTADRLAGAVRAKAGEPTYPSSELAAQMRIVARLIKAGAGARAYYTRQTGYDTHALQAGAHAALLRDYADALRAFFDDLGAAKLAERVLVLTFSEFGRTVRENGSGGTDHGTAGPVFLAGPRFKAAVVGKAPDLGDLDPRHGDLRVGADFRGVYAEVLEGWLGLKGRAVLGRDWRKPGALGG
jgi:uncharacterized protein (DUF1501 family)